MGVIMQPSQVLLQQFLSPTTSHIPVGYHTRHYWTEDQAYNTNFLVL